jgi:hypothetical protein
VSLRRYVILCHEGIDQPHFDLMFETAPGALLATWRSTKWPPDAGDTLERLADHRRKYLTYEGPLSERGGRVRRVESGTCEIGHPSENAWLIRLADPRPMRPPLALLLQQRPDGLWSATVGA